MMITGISSPKQRCIEAHAPRQSGKTTAIQEIVRLLNEQGTYNAVYINIENAQAARDNIKEALLNIAETLRYAIQQQTADNEKTLAYLLPK